MAIITGTSVAETLNSGVAADRLNGLGGDDTLNGGGGNDTLDGGTGNDSMIGGAGNDTYVVDSEDDVVTEGAAAGGVDLVKSSVSYTLTQSNIENLALIGGGSVDGTGNALANTLTGNSGNNLLDGAGGADTMAGGAGNDIYIVNNVGDVVIEQAGRGYDAIDSSATFTLSANVEELVLTGGGNINGTGNLLNNVLSGNGGNNVLDGRAGSDVLVGGAGNDTYVITDLLDTVFEAPGEGNDTLIANMSYALPDEFEKLTLTGNGDFSATGNGLNNTLTGNSGNNVLDGATGVDTMAGGAGNDLYFVNAALDKVVEAGAQGTDTVNSTVTYTLGLNVEKLIQGGAANIAGTGNTLNNTLTGNTGNNTLNGLGGNDTVNGGAGADTLNGGIGADSLVGGAGNDTLIWDAPDVKVNGGTDTDTLRVTGVTALNLTAVADSVVVDVEIIDLAGTNTLTLAATDVLAISSTTDILRVDGGAGDAVIGAGWTKIADTTINSQDYAQYTQDGATLQVDLDVDRSGIVVEGLSFAALDGTNGFQIFGEAVDDRSGRSVSGAGDVNGDGFDDLLIGARGPGPYGADSGASYVVFGGASGFGSKFDLSALDGTNGFQLSGEAMGFLSLNGFSVSTAGDVNGDGYSDLIIGAYGADENGASYVVFGHASGFASNLELTALDGSSGFRLSGEAAGDFAGYSVSAAGDVNGDGYADLLIGALGVDLHGIQSGAAYMVFGHANGFGTNLELSALDGTNGFQLSGSAVEDRAGISVSAAGDMNGDGFDDFIVGATGTDLNGFSSGTAYVLFGQASGFASNFELSAVDGTNGFLIPGEGGFDYAGFSVAAAGDVNGDGLADIIVGAYRALDYTGASYVVFGDASSFGSKLELSTLDGTNGFQISGEAFDDRAGNSVSGAGDVNGDGYADLLIGAARSDSNGITSGASYVVFGQASGFGANLELSALDGTNGFQLSGEAFYDRSGFSVSAAGDMNGDGFDDLLIGAPGVSQAGASYVVYGRDFNEVVDFLGGAGNESLTGGGGAEVFVGGLGNDTLDGAGGADVLKGAGGNDVLVFDSADRLVEGGSGTDTLRFAGIAEALDLTGISNTQYTGIEVVDLTGIGNNSLTLAVADVLDLSDSTNTLRVVGDSQDAVISTGQGWVAGDTVDVGGVMYLSYTAGAATLLLHPDLELASTIS